jgi:streptogramin lyase
MAPSTETKIWKPEEEETLEGTVHALGSVQVAVQTEDGSVWLLEADAENQLAALEPAEGQRVRVSFAHQSWPRSNYSVRLL